ncbi:MAG: helix-turn-helix domain-containing protein [Solirubrobacteraceae bacterium]
MGQTRDGELARALVLSLDDEALDLLVDRLAPRIHARLRDRADRHLSDEWLDSKRAAAYLGVSVNALHKLTAARTIPFEQDSPGCKCWFRRAELDKWRRGG